jgi:hypothetical protein
VRARGNGLHGVATSHALNVCGGNTKDAYDFLSSSNELVSSSRGGTQAAALFDFDSTKPRQVFDENVDGQVDYSSSTLNMTTGHHNQMHRLAHFVLATVIVLREPSSLAPLIKMYKTSTPDRLRQSKQRS